MRTSHLKKILKQKKWEDTWWLCCGKELHPEVLNISQIEVFLAHNGGDDIAVLHVNEAGTNAECWLYLTTESDDTPSSRGSKAISNGELKDIVGQVSATQELIRMLTDRISRVESHILVLDKPVREALDIIEERARFLNESEEALIAKMDEQERTQAELDQLREDLATQQAFKVVSGS